MIASTSKTMLRTIAARPATARLVLATATRPLSTTPTKKFSLFGLFSRKPSAPTAGAAGLSSHTSDVAPTTTSASDPASQASEAIAKATATNPTKQSTAEKGKADVDQAKMKGKMLARDQELLAKLLDREGGSAGVSIVNGRYEEGLGPETKKNMFRLI
ncbi:hypothetical protein NDA17_005823 [Ustilago hordei]|nr:hypothetical protein NDA17_005823 [Ustilago hordei]